MGEFGNKFRKAREKKQLSFDDVSKVLKISSRMLQAIEEEHFDLLPGGVFNKGFIRSYAKHLDLDPEQAVADYLSLQQAEIDALEVLQSESTPAARSSAKLRPVGMKKAGSKSQEPAETEELPNLQLPRVGHVRPGRKEFIGGREGIPWSLIAAAAAVIILGILVWIRHSRANHPAPRPANVTTAQPAAPVVAPPVANQVPASRKTTTPPRASTSSPAKSGTGIRHDLVPPTPAAATEAAKPATLSLVIRAEENSWISVQADGKQVLEETLIAPARTSVHANQQIVVKVGNAAGVSFLFNGVEVSPQGNQSEVKTLVFDPTGMKLPP
jgi:cytoskeleton protein RodZ